ncbi:MAG TPA: hypothetical protein VMO17_03680 [Terriglobia bacterium]|nr:hypothetical protein [Terriglobia bacterium]
MNNVTNAANLSRKQGSPLFYFLAFVMAVFIGILIFVYIVTKRTHPIFLDEHGKPTNAEPVSANKSRGK